MLNPMLEPDLSRLTERGVRIYEYLMSCGFITKIGAFEFVSGMYLDEQRDYAVAAGLEVAHVGR